MGTQSTFGCTLVQSLVKAFPGPGTLHKLRHFLSLPYLSPWKAMETKIHSRAQCMWMGRVHPGTQESNVLSWECAKDLGRFASPDLSCLPLPAGRAGSIHCVICQQVVPTVLRGWGNGAEKTLSQGSSWPLGQLCCGGSPCPPRRAITCPPRRAIT